MSNYNAAQFRAYQRKRLKGFSYHRKPRGVRKKFDVVPTGNGYIDLIGAIVLHAVKDYHQGCRLRHAARPPKGTNNPHVVSRELGFADLLADVDAYFRGDDFAAHCQVLGIEPQRLLTRYQIVLE